MNLKLIRWLSTIFEAANNYSEGCFSMDKSIPVLLLMLSFIGVFGIVKTSSVNIDANGEETELLSNCGEVLRIGCPDKNGTLYGSLKLYDRSRLIGGTCAVNFTISSSCNNLFGLKYSFYFHFRKVRFLNEEDTLDIYEDNNRPIYLKRGYFWINQFKTTWSKAPFVSFKYKRNSLTVYNEATLDYTIVHESDADNYYYCPALSGFVHPVVYCNSSSYIRCPAGDSVKGNYSSSLGVRKYQRHCPVVAPATPLTTCRPCMPATISSMITKLRTTPTTTPKSKTEVTTTKCNGHPLCSGFSGGEVIGIACGAIVGTIVLICLLIVSLMFVHPTRLLIERFFQSPQAQTPDPCSGRTQTLKSPDPPKQPGQNLPPPPIQPKPLHLKIITNQIADNNIYLEVEH